MAQIIDLGKIRFNWAGTYSGSTEYSYNDLVKYGPNLYAFTSSEASTGVVPTNAAKWTIATEGIDYRGTYTNATLYYVNDIVTDGTNTYIVITQHTASSGVASGNANLNVIALGQAGLPSQTGNTNKVLATNGTATSWASTLYLSKTYVGNSQGQAALTFESSASLTDVMGIFSASTGDFGQLVVVNGSNGADASTDLIVYTADGTNDSGWIDMGITSNDFDAATFGITGPHDGYVFMSAPRTTQFSVTTKLVASGSATLTTSTAHGFTTGDEIRVEGVGAGFDGIRTVTTVPSSLTFRFVTTAGAIEATPVSPAGTTYKPTGDGNLVFATDETGLRNKIVFAAGGFASGTSQMEITPNEVVNITISTASTTTTSGALVVAGGVGIGSNLNMNGNFANSGLLTNTGIAYIGSGAATFAGNTQGNLTSPAAVFTVNSAAASFGQIAFRNARSTSSTDMIVYMNNGNDNNGWMGMGIAGSAFDDTTYGITAPGDGYIFHNAIDDTYLGNMVFATGAEGSENKIVFAAGGFDSGTTQMEITPGVNVHIEIPTPSTSPSTGALTVVGGVGISGDMNIQGDVNVVGTITFGGAGTTVETSNLAVTDPFVFVGSGNQGDAVDLGFITEHTVAVSAITATVTNKALASNVATLTTSAAHNYRAGDVVVVSSVDATFNGTYSIIAVPTSTTFTYAKTNANVTSAATATGSTSVSARRVYDGVARDATDAVIKFFQGAVTKPSTTVNFAEAGLTDAAIKAGNGTFTGTLTVTGTATVATPTTSSHATTKSYVDAQDRSMLTQTAIVSGDYTYDASNRLTKYKASANKTVQSITYNSSGYIATYQEVVTIGGSAVTTSYTVTTNSSGNITAISAA